MSRDLLVLFLLELLTVLHIINAIASLVRLQGSCNWLRYYGL